MPDILEALKSEHDTTEDLFRRIEEIGRGGPADDRRATLDELVPHLRAHVAAEREVVVPAIIHAVPDGPEQAASETELLDQIDETLSRVESTSSDEPGHEEALLRLVEQVREHILEWDEDLLPSLGEGLEESNREELGEAFARAREQRGEVGETTP